MKTFTLKFTEAELETIAAAMDDYMAYADDEFASADDLIDGLPVADRVYSIHLNSLRVDVWTMPGGGFTTREMFPVGLCKFVEIDNFLSYIYALKQTEK